jgi:CBS domain-containing protein
MLTGIAVDDAWTAVGSLTAHALLEHNIRCVPVIDIGESLIGVVSEADLISREGYPTVRGHHLSELVEDEWTEHRHHWAARAEGLTAGEIMTGRVITCRPDELVTIDYPADAPQRRSHPASSGRRGQTRRDDISQ